MSKQEMELEECKSLLLDRIWPLHPRNPEGSVAHIFSSKAPAEIGQLLAPDDKIAPLIVEAAQQFPELPPLQTPKSGMAYDHSPTCALTFIQLTVFKELRLHFTVPIHGLSFILGAFLMNFWPHSPFPIFSHSAFLMNFRLRSPCPIYSFSFASLAFLMSKAPLPLKVQIGPLHPGLPQLHPSGSFHGIHAPLTPISPTVAFQSPSPKSSGSGELMLEKEIRELLFLLRPSSLPIESLANMYIDRYRKPLRIEGFLAEGLQHGKIGYSLTHLLMRLNTIRVIERNSSILSLWKMLLCTWLMVSNWVCLLLAVIRTKFILLPLGSKFTDGDVRNYFSQYGIVNDVRIPPQGRHTHGFVRFQDPSAARQILSERAPHFICVDQVCVKEYKDRHELDFRWKPHYTVPVAHTPKYLAHGFKLGVPSARSDPNQICVVFMPESKFTEEDVRNYFCFQDSKMAERILSEGTCHFICGDQIRVKVYKEKHELQRGQHHGFKMEPLPSAENSSNQIFITFDPKSIFTENDAWNYFSHYGPVNNVQIPFRKKRAFGYVSFKYPETVKRILSERCSRTSHFICGHHVFVEPHIEKHGQEMLAQEVGYSILPGPHEVPDVSVIHEHHTAISWPISAEEQLSSDHELFGEKLNKGGDQGIVTEKSNTNIVPVMVLPPTHNLSVYSVSETSPTQGDNTAESSHVSNCVDEASAVQDSDDLRLPETLDDVY